MKRMTLRIDQLDPPSTFHPRVRDAKVDMLASWMQRTFMSPILVAPKGERYAVLDGMHRVAACKVLGIETIEAEVDERFVHMHPTWGTEC